MGRPRSFDASAALDCATWEFWEKGYAGTTLDDLTASMGINRPSLYRSFGNKEALFERAVKHFEKTYLAFFEAAMSRASARETIERLLEGTAHICAGAKTPRGSLLIHGAPATSHEDAPVRRFLSNRIFAFEERLVRRLARARAEGDLDAATDERALASFIITHCCGMALRAKAGLTRQMLDAEITLAMDAVRPHLAQGASDGGSVGAPRVPSKS